MSNWELLTTVIGSPQAELVASFLRGEGIPVQFRSHVPPSVYPFTVNGLAEVRVLVPAVDLDRAREVLAAFRMGEEDDHGDRPPC
ncbi:MAG TPA: DUF2007 domain-containing protein [Candidatus Bipolaricaulis anaerobius]|nr:DUF2007 domain-containing protein [Candidatus Bipolaricaulis anaerobius]